MKELLFIKLASAHNWQSQIVRLARAVRSHESSRADRRAKKRVILLATGNPGKFKEISEILSGLPFKLLFLKDLNVDASSFSEDGETFEENARKKALYFREKTGFLTLAEDSGIIVDALEGELGVKTRRWGLGEGVSDQEWVDYFLKRMGGEDNRRAKFVCNACVIGDGIDVCFTGETSGIITDKLLAPILPGLPLSSCFLPDGCDKVYAALSTSQKNEISHRGKAMGMVKDFLGKGTFEKDSSTSLSENFDPCEGGIFSV